MATDVQLRPVHVKDIAEFYSHHVELHPPPATAIPDAIAAEKAQFVERWERMLREGIVLTRSILWDGRLAGYVTHFVQLERPAIAYWLRRDCWGRGIATQAIKDFLRLVEPRPLYARAAWDNYASLRVLQKVGFVVVGKDTFFSTVHGAEVEEVILALP